MGRFRLEVAVLRDISIRSGGAGRRAGRAGGRLGAHFHAARPNPGHEKRRGREGGRVRPGDHVRAERRSKEILWGLVPKPFSCDLTFKFLEEYRHAILF